MKTPRRFRVRLLAWATVVLIAVGSARAQVVSLERYLPYQPEVTTRLTSEIGFDLEFRGLTETEFQWEVGNGISEGLRSRFRLDATGLALVNEQGVFTSGDTAYSENYIPEWILSQPEVELGATYESTGSYIGNEFEDEWTGNAEGVLAVGETFEIIETPIGTFEALKLSFESVWSESGPGFSASGETGQDWWVVEDVGVVQVVYRFEETVLEDGEAPESDSFELSFELESGSEFSPKIVNILQPVVVFEGEEASFSVESEGLGPLEYTWQMQPELGRITTLAETGPTLTLESVALVDAGFYWVRVSNAFGAIQVDPVQLTVLPDDPAGSIADPNLELAIRETLGVAEGEPIREVDMDRLTQLVAIDRGITDLRGLEQAVNLRELTLRVNQISDLKPLESLPELWLLRLHDNPIQDISPLATLPKLNNLEISLAQVRDLSPLANHPSLFALNLQNNAISDISPLASIPNLGTVLIAANFIDIAPGSEARSIIDSWSSRGVNVIFEPQFPAPEPEAPSLTISRIDTGIRLRWETLIGLGYAIQFGEALGEWNDEPVSETQGTGGVVVVDLEIPDGSVSGFYRVLVR